MCFMYRDILYERHLPELKYFHWLEQVLNNPRGHKEFELDQKLVTPRRRTER